MENGFFINFIKYFLILDMGLWLRDEFSGYFIDYSIKFLKVNGSSVIEKWDFAVQFSHYFP